MAASVAKATAVVDVVVTVIFNFSAMVVMFTKIAIDFLFNRGDAVHHCNKCFDGYLCHRDYQGHHSSLVAMVRRTR